MNDVFATITKNRNELVIAMNRKTAYRGEAKIDPKLASKQPVDKSPSTRLLITKLCHKKHFPSPECLVGATDFTKHYSYLDS